MKRFVIGDIHNNATALKQCLKRSSFDKDNDVLISLGDIVDGPCLDLYDVFEELLSIKKLYITLGNHDFWFKNWIESGIELPIHIHQGGYQSILAYDSKPETVPQSHIDLLKNALPYYIDENDNLFVHGGFNPKQPIESQDPEYLMWDRDLAYKYGRGYATHFVEPYTHVFLGHTSTQGIAHDWQATDPITIWNVTCLDTGGGWNGKLTIMNVDTLKCWQSDVQTPE